MGKLFAELDDDLRAFIARQHLFFVATAPLSADGHVNLSPKGLRGTASVVIWCGATFRTTFSIGG